MPGSANSYVRVDNMYICESYVCICTYVQVINNILCIVRLGICTHNHRYVKLFDKRKCADSRCIYLHVLWRATVGNWW